MFIRNRRDWIHVLSALAAPVVLFWPYVFGIGSATGLALYMVLLLIWIVDVNYVLHLHSHHPFTSSNAANRFLDICLGSVTGMTSANWRIQHIFGHHRGHDQEYTYGSLRWTMECYSMRGALLYSFGNVVPTFCRPIVESFRKGVLDNMKEPLNYRSAFIEQAGFLLFVLVLALYKPRLTLEFLLPWYFMIFAMTRYVDYLNHYGCTDDGFNFANNTLSRAFNWRIKNFGYHTAHHIDPAAHWTSLPLLHAKIADRIPPERVKTFDWCVLLLPYHAWCERPSNRIVLSSRADRRIKING